MENNVALLFDFRELPACQQAAPSKFKNKFNDCFKLESSFIAFSFISFTSVASERDLVSIAEGSPRDPCSSSCQDVVKGLQVKFRQKESNRRDYSK